MPESPTPSVNGQVLGSPAAHDSRSISSLEPAATMVGRLASTATDGSFCLFCANGVAGLPTDTSVSLPVTPELAAGNNANMALPTTAASNSNRLDVIDSPL